MYYCNCCNHKIRKWRPWGSDAGIYKEHHIIGGGLRNCLCPKCGSIDRHRWMMYILEKYTNVFTGKCSVLHIAPETEIKRRILNNPASWYVSGDIDGSSVDVQMDVCEIPFKDKLFDYIIINHVLSYIANERKAFEEMKRCLKDDGVIILSFPICVDSNTWENQEVVGQGMSLEMFGTEDNVRMYGNDYITHLEMFGLQIKTYSPNNMLSANEIERYSFIPDDVTIFAQKKE